MTSAKRLVRKARSTSLSDMASASSYEVAASAHTLPVGWVDPEDVAAAAAYLASDDARYLTGSTLVVDAGATSR